MDSSAIERRSWSRLNQFIALVPNTREHKLFLASRLLAVTALEVSSVLGINFGSEGVRVAFLGCADGLIANIRELLRVLAVGALAVSTHHQRSETLAVSAFVRAGVCGLTSARRGTRPSAAQIITPPVALSDQTSIYIRTI